MAEARIDTQEAHPRLSIPKGLLTDLRGYRAIMGGLAIAYANVDEGTGDWAVPEERLTQENVLATARVAAVVASLPEPLTARLSEEMIFNRVLVRMKSTRE